MLNGFVAIASCAWFLVLWFLLLLVGLWSHVSFAVAVVLSPIIKPLLFKSLLSIVRAHFELKTKIMRIFDHYSKILK